MFCGVNWYGSGLFHILHQNTKVTNPPIHPLPLNNPYLHLSLCWLLVVNFFDKHCRTTLPSIVTIAYIAQCPKKHCLPPLHRRAHCFVLSSSLPGALLCFAHPPNSLFAHTPHHARSPLSPFEDSRTDNGHHGSPDYPTIQHYLYEGGISVKHYYF